MLLLIDLDNTLIDRQRGFERWTMVFLDGLKSAEAEEFAWLRSMDGDGVTPRHEFFRQARVRYGLAATVEDLVAAYQALMPQLIPPPSPETLSALRTARENGFKTCIVTNGSRATQEPKILSDLAEAVDGWVISGEIGVRKPDPAILRYAAKACGEPLTPQSWMIGDRPEADILCAHRGGIRSVWLPRGAEWDEQLDYRPNLTAASFAEAVERIRALRQP